MSSVRGSMSISRRIITISQSGRLLVAGVLVEGAARLAVEQEAHAWVIRGQVEVANHVTILYITTLL